MSTCLYVGSMLNEQEDDLSLLITYCCRSVLICLCVCVSAYLYVGAMLNEQEDDISLARGCREMQSSLEAQGARAVDIWQAAPQVSVFVLLY